MCVFSHVWLFMTPWTVACQAPLSMNFPGRNTGVGCHLLLQGIFSTQGWNLCFPALTGWFFTTGPPGKPKSGMTKKWSTSKKCLKKFVHLNFYIWGQHYTKPGKKKSMIRSHLVGDHLRHDYGIIPREWESLYKTIEQMWKADGFRAQSLEQMPAFGASLCFYVCACSVVFDSLWPHGL